MTKDKTVSDMIKVGSSTLDCVTISILQTNECFIHVYIMQLIKAAERHSALLIS
jgi:hypothetical protein